MAVVLQPSALPEFFQIMLKYPESRSHMLFLGPPGSGKTTTAQSFASALHGQKQNQFSSLLFLNSSDERSLETMRHKIYPFVESRMQTLFFAPGQAPPKVLIFDEAETLTDQAQCALRPLIQRSTKEVILIFICNSLSHIHPQILNKFLIVPFTPTPSQRLQKILSLEVPGFDSLFRRGDIRFFKQCPQHAKQITRFLFRSLHATSQEELYQLVTESGTPFRERITWFLLFQQMHGSIPSKELSLWSAITASETQSSLTDSITQTLLFKLWKTRMALFIPPLSSNKS
uniref:AAA+ ATPase domain-containing protein n=1 Tax=viral metagenome TaxID=1070528 RepID=A0A6C0DP64_9ZZZZ